MTRPFFPLTFPRPEHGLQKAVKDILANCGQSAQQAKDVDAVKHVDEKQVALILSRA
jgi:hypothetical protein